MFLTQYSSLGDLVAVYAFYAAATHAEQYLTPAYLDLPHPALYTLARVAIWALYGFAAGLPLTGIWVIAHECGHQAFSDSKFFMRLSSESATPPYSLAS